MHWIYPLPFRDGGDEVRQHLLPHLLTIIAVMTPRGHPRVHRVAVRKRIIVVIVIVIVVVVVEVVVVGKFSLVSMA